MKIHVTILAIFLSTIFLCHDKVEGSRWSLSEDEDFEIERQLKLLNKPAKKTIQSKFGDEYDCVDFYDQPAFDHPLLKNETFHLQVESISSHNMKNDQFFSEDVPSFGLQGEECPVGTVPIKRITKQDLIREKIALKDRVNDGPEYDDVYTHVAVAKTIFNTHKYSGAGGILSIHNPNATGPQYSGCRILIQSDTDVIQVGWRVDPFLYGDSKTRFFIRTDTGNSHCFGLRCSTFVHTNQRIPIDGIFQFISSPRGSTFEIQLDIKMDSSGNWRLSMGAYDRIEIGFWPQNIFKDTGLKQLANHIEWGGEVYSPPPVPKPPMGNGALPTPFRFGQDSYIRQTTFRNEQGSRKVNAVDAQAYGDNIDYLVFDLPYPSEAMDYWGHVVLYGGPGGGIT